MSAWRLALAGILVVALAGGVLAQDKDKKEEKKENKDKIVGVWEVAKADQGTIPVGATIEFTKDGKMKIAIKDMSIEGTYKVDGDKLNLMKDGDEKDKKTITIKKLTDTEFVAEGDDKKTVEFKKKVKTEKKDK